jgi:hypothetical protein
MSMGFSTTPLVSRHKAAVRDAEGNPKPTQHFHYLDIKLSHLSRPPVSKNPGWRIFRFMVTVG